MMLFEDSSSPTKIYIELKENPEGGISVAGQDIGEVPRLHFGGDDYEYGLTIPAEGVRALAIQLLAEKYRDDPDVVSKLRQYCDLQQIPCSFWSYP